MRSWTDTLRFAFQPVVDLATGGVVGLETLARPEAGDILAQARRDPELDGRLAVSAVRAAAVKETPATPSRERVRRHPGPRVGHIGGDDFLVPADPEVLETLAASVLDAPWPAGGQPVTLSLATVLCRPGSVTDHRRGGGVFAFEGGRESNARGELGGRAHGAGRAGYEIRRGSPPMAPAGTGAATRPGVGRPGVGGRAGG